MVYLPPPNPQDHHHAHGFAQGIECPRCGRHSIVIHGDSLYACLSCDWFRDLSHEREHRQSFSFPQFLFIAALAVLIIRLLASV